VPELSPASAKINRRAQRTQNRVRLRLIRIRFITRKTDQSGIRWSLVTATKRGRVIPAAPTIPAASMAAG
jgi:hypothetical protein